MINITQALMWFFVGLILTNGLKLIHLKSGIKKYSELPESVRINKEGLKKIALIKYLPFSSAYYLIIWLFCSIFYFKNIAIHANIVHGLILGVIWWLGVIALEMIAWVIIKHQYSFSWKQMYLKSQPWTSLNYYAILISPIIIAFIVNFNKI